MTASDLVDPNIGLTIVICYFASISPKYKTLVLKPYRRRQSSLHDDAKRFGSTLQGVVDER